MAVSNENLLKELEKWSLEPFHKFKKAFPREERNKDFLTGLVFRKAVYYRAARTRRIREMLALLKERVPSFKEVYLHPRPWLEKTIELLKKKLPVFSIAKGGLSFRAYPLLCSETRTIPEEWIQQFFFYDLKKGYEDYDGFLSLEERFWRKGEPRGVEVYPHRVDEMEKLFEKIREYFLSEDGEEVVMMASEREYPSLDSDYDKRSFWGRGR